MSVIKNSDTYTPLPNNEEHNCFGCSPSNPSGMQMKFHINEKRDSVLSWFSVPDHFCGWGNVVHGGIIFTLLDEAMGWAGFAILKQFFLSKSISVDFVKPVLTGTELRVEGRVLETIGEKKAILRGILYCNDEVRAKSTSTVSLFSPETARKFGVSDQMFSSLEQTLNEPS